MEISDSRIKTSISLLPKTANKKILEIGFNQYSFSNMIDAEVYMGLDIKIANPPVKLLPVRGDAIAIPFKKHSFDLVILTEVIEHIEKPANALCEINRILVPGGGLLLSTPNADSIDFRVGRMLRMNVKRFYMSPEHVHEYTWKEMSLLFQKCGFECMVRRGVAVKIPRIGYSYLLQRLLPGFCEYTVALLIKVDEC